MTIYRDSFFLCMEECRYVFCVFRLFLRWLVSTTIMCTFHFYYLSNISEYIFILFLLIWHYIHHYYYIFYVCVLSMCTQTILSKQKTRNQTTTKEKYTRTFTLRRDEKCVKQCSRQANFRRSVNTRTHTLTHMS